MLVACRKTLVLVDCGFSLRETERRLARLGVAASRLTALVLTHEHGDHADGAEVLARRHGLPVWLTHGTADALGIEPDPAHLFSGSRAFAVQDIEFHPFTVPHDAREPCQFVFTNGVHRLGLLTDAGHITPHMTECLRGCDALVLESNHDAEMLAESDYPASLKTRIGGMHGHLDNDSAASLLASLETDRLQHIVAAHLSEKNNTPWLVKSTLGSVLNGRDERITVASQDGGLAWRELV